MLAENNLNTESCQAMKTRTEIHCKMQRVDFAFVQEAYGIPRLMKNLGSILITSGSVVLGLSHLSG